MTIFLNCGIFLIKKTASFKKMLTEQEAIKYIADGKLLFSPLTITLKSVSAPPQRYKADMLLEVGWENKTYDFGVEYKSRSTPKEFRLAIDQVVRASSASGLSPLILMPFLKEQQLLELAERKISGLDFSGNGVVVVPDQLLVFRSGSPNQFPASETIQNVYRRNSAIVPRALLACPVFETVNSVEAFILLRGGHIPSISLSTVSKVLKVLEEDLIISRENAQIRLIQPEKLLDKLVGNYTRPVVRRFLVGKSPQDTTTLAGVLAQNSTRFQVWLVGTGVGSVTQYAAMTRENFLSVYCTDQYRLLTGIEFKETNRFPNLEVIETPDKTVYFDSRTANGFEWASPVQTYLELMAGDQRDRDTATQVKALILADVKRQLM